MYVKDVVVQNQVGLHARPATFFIQKANEFKSSIWIEKEDRRFIAKSLLGILSLGIGLLWLTPYMTATYAHFYEDVKAEYEAKQAAAKPVEA